VVENAEAIDQRIVGLLEALSVVKDAL